MARFVVCAVGYGPAQTDCTDRRHVFSGGKMTMFIRTLALGAILVAFLGTAVGEAEVDTTAHASATSRGLVIDTGRFFPLMLIDQCTAQDVAQGKALGINLVLNESCPGLTPDDQLALLRGSSLAVLPIGARRTRGPGLVGWTYPDEPDNNGWTPASLAKADPYDRGNIDGLVTFLTTTGRFYHQAPFGSPQASASRYAAFAGMADMAGFDLYPLNACQSDLTTVYYAQREFVKLAGTTPTFQWIETGPIRPAYCGGFAMTPEELIAEVWLAVIGGARGIGYFTHTWTPAHDSLALSPPMATAIRQTNSLLAAVKPGLLGATIKSSADSPVVKVVARSGGGRTYVFAINAMRSPNKAGIRVPQLRDGLATVVGEGRTVVVKNHRLIDHFGGLQVNVYVQTH